MKKKLLSTAAAIAALSAMYAVPALALGLGEGEQSTEVTGSNEIYTPKIDIALPGDLSFGINPLSYDTDGDPATTDDQIQIVATDYLMENYSDVPVAIKTATKAEKGDGEGTTAVITNGALYNTESGELQVSKDASEVFLLQVLPQVGAISQDADGVFFINNAGIDLTTITNEATALSKGACVLSTGANDITFILDKITTGATELDQISGFTFSGAVDPQATFVGDDVKVTTVFTLEVLSDAQYARSYDLNPDFTGVDRSVAVLTGDALK